MRGCHLPALLSGLDEVEDLRRRGHHVHGQVRNVKPFVFIQPNGHRPFLESRVGIKEVSYSLIIALQEADNEKVLNSILQREKNI